MIFVLIVISAIILPIIGVYLTTIICCSGDDLEPYLINKIFPWCKRNGRPMDT